MERIAVWVSDYDIDYSPSILNLLGCLVDHYRVDLYASRVWAMASPLLASNALEVIVISEPPTPARLARTARSVLKRWLEAAARGRLPEPRPANRLVLDPARTAELARRRDYLTHICFDPTGLLLCTGSLPEARPIYYSLELYLEDDYLDTYYSGAALAEIRTLMAAERRVVDRIAGLVIQSEERAGLFLANHGLGPELPLFLLPVTSLEPAVVERSTALHAELGLDPARCRLALHLGGMNDWFSSIEIAREFAVVDGWELFFQGNHRRDYLARFHRVMREEGIDGAHVSRRFYDDIAEVDRIVASCRAGIAWYNDISKNMATAGRSSGKIASYLRFGLPVLAKRYPSTIEALEVPGCGVCVDDVGEIPEAMARITRDLEGMSERCRQEYERHYWFERYRQPLLEFVASTGRAGAAP